ncbi:energy-coupling factor ABC transporter ATP-binding protein [Wansuia hejianensis]|uniref:ABC transporter ATP-binding protein n=1 Tax=Wansuia hejianensis TaxID=2763667 RepID=A0A926F1N0_9FIRM|nr:ATP-binding cassette domain-containing protein [Wansuia hejianensis]MBC8591407.1 ATP-binding cassette domain-containing protein [Wansuia hejianensis]
MIKINSLEYKYQDGTVALKDINLDLEKGNIIGIIGANGSGKSTLFLNIMGILKPLKGNIEFQGKKLKYDKKSLRQYRKEVGMVFQDPEKQIFYSRVEDDVAFSLRNLNYKEDEIKKRVKRSLDKVGAIKLRDKATHFLSYGEKKRVAIAGNLVMENKVLLLDEPTSGLDPKMTREMKNIIKDLGKDKKLIISSHDMDFIYEICDYIYVLKEGEIVGYGPTVEIFKRKELLEKSLLDRPWLVKVHEILEIPLYRNEEEFIKGIRKDLNR